MNTGQYVSFTSEVGQIMTDLNYFLANIRDFCIMEDFINPPKEVDSDKYCISTKRPKEMAAQRGLFPPQE